LIRRRRLRGSIPASMGPGFSRPSGAAAAPLRNGCFKVQRPGLPGIAPSVRIGASTCSLSVLPSKPPRGFSILDDPRIRKPFIPRSALLNPGCKRVQTSCVFVLPEIYSNGSGFTLSLSLSCSMDGKRNTLLDPFARPANTSTLCIAADRAFRACSSSAQAVTGSFKAIEHNAAIQGRLSSPLRGQN